MLSEGALGEKAIDIDSNKDDDKHCIIIAEPENLKLVNQEYDILQRAISELGSKVSGVLQKRETEFLTAYKAHMRNVTKDFNELQQEMADTTAAVENNVLVKKLEADRDAYKVEALHLDSVLTKIKKREKSLSEKVDELEHDRNWLSNQLKDTMKQKNALERRLGLDQECHEESSCHRSEDEDG